MSKKMRAAAQALVLAVLARTNLGSTATYQALLSR
ncbi:hypothetical protein SAMN05428981_11266 [Bacillus sp. OV194]|nr:hypothetical protein SAMN05428981_11266 [Bacillus sp. OV194]